MTRRTTHHDTGSHRGRCLSELSVLVLVSGALALSALLWFAIYTVI
ncbi:hypothetical protein [Ruegeria sp. Ofav3-42]|nr:hypothetical protein [Ruegeria sp. Ofav3-42]MCG7521394.1 hypothetical protein [Ruegeria sp. Ofav3-42]